MRSTILAITLFATLATLSLMPAPAAADVDEGTITVIQPKPVVRRHRAALTPRFSMSINDPLLQQFAAGGGLSFHITERWFVQGSFDWFDFGQALGGTTRRYEDVIAATGSVPEIATIDWFAGLEAGFTPAWGKVVLFQRVIIFWDTFVTLGAGVVDSTDIHPAFATGSLGLNVYFSRWLALTMDIRDRLSSESLPSGNALTHTVTSSVGFSILMPFNFRYSFEREEEQ
jgi:outer membrane beta-barrel protein